MSNILLCIEDKGASSSGEERPVICLPLVQGEPQQKSETAFSVQSNGRYSFYLKCSKQTAKTCADWRLWLNGDMVSSVPHWNAEEKTVELSVESRPFRDQLGFANFALRLEPDAEEKDALFAPPVPITFNKPGLAKQITEITDYVLAHAQGLLMNRKKAILSRSSKEQSPDINNVIEFLKDIIKVYQFDADYFRSNSRSRVLISGRVDALEKLRYFTPETLRFITMHPEELVPSSHSTGIRFGGRSFIPQRTWIQGDKVDRNVYENQIVLGFLPTVISYAQKLIGLLTEKDRATLENASDLADSAKIILNADKEWIKDIRNELISLRDRLQSLFITYREFLGATPALVSRVPEPTAVFLRIPAYNRVYNLLDQWFHLREVTFKKNTFFFDAWKVSRVYEYYCLIRLIEEIQSLGFEIDYQDNFNWEELPNIDEADKINNIYLFRRNTETITLYYEPKITCQLNKESDLYLYKNSTGYLRKIDSNSLIFEKGSDKSWYTPDFVIKRQIDGKASYLIADAKFSTQDDIVHLQLVPVLFKYQVSISPARKEDRISGLSIFCGKRSSKDKAEEVPLFNVANPLSKGYPTVGLNLKLIMPGSTDRLLPIDFLAS